MNKYIDKKLFMQSLYESMNAALAILVGGIIILLFKFFILYNNLLSIYTSTMTYNIIDIPLFVSMFLGSTLICRKTLSFLWDTKKTDYLYSLPYTKKQIYITKLAAVISLQFAIIVLITFIGIVISLTQIGKTFFLSDWLMIMLNMMVGSLLIIGALFLSTSVTGKKASAALLADGILLVPALPYIIHLFIAVYGSVIQENVYIIKSYLYIFPNILITTFGEHDLSYYWSSIIFSFDFGIMLIVFGYLLFKRRSGEVTGNYTKNKVTHFIVMGIIPFTIVFITILFAIVQKKIDSYGISLLAAFSGISLLSAFLYEAIVNKKIRKKNRCIWVFLISAIVAFAINYSVLSCIPENENADMFIPRGFNDRISYYKYNRITYGDYLQNSSDSESLYIPMPEEYVTFIYDNNMSGIKGRQSELKEIYNKLAEEFELLEEHEKKEILYASFASSNMTYDNIYMNYRYSDEFIIVPMNVLYIKGRAGSTDIIDHYSITYKTPEAANMYIKMVNKENTESYNRFIKEYIESSVIEKYSFQIAFYVLNNEGEQVIYGINFRNKYSYEYYDDMANEVLDIIKEMDVVTPDVNDNIMVLNYRDDETWYFKTLFVKINNEQLEQFIEIHNELNPE